MKRKDFNSEEEWQYHHWLIEAENIDLITGWAYEPRTFELSKKQTYPELKVLKTKTKTVHKHLLNGHVYTPDFMFALNREHDLAPMIIKQLKVSQDGLYWIDVKGMYSKFDGGRSFSINQKWLYSKHKIYANKLIPVKFFKALWVPEAIIYGKKNTRLKRWERYKLLSDLL